MSIDKRKNQDGLDETTKIIIAALAGAAVGATLALLLAPSSGKDTRESIGDLMGSVKDSLKDLAKQGEDLAKKAKESLKDLAEQGEELAEEAVDKVKDAAK